MGKVLFIEYRRCSTCVKAHKWLDAHGVDYEERSIVDDVPTASELKEWHEASGLPIKRFFNTSGKLYRELNVKEKFNEGMTDEEAYELLSTDGMLIKRPVLVGDEFVTTGFKEDKWAELLGVEA